MAILNFIEGMAKLHTPLMILSVGSLVSVTVAGKKEPAFTIPCDSCRGADLISSSLEELYFSKLN